ncbi:MAG: 23S rRNA (pseudouridine(1915)-N(3))-methyltransferase RlmH [Paenibacillaceae bacterium]
MNIQIVAVGKLKEKYWVQGIEEYIKRLGPYAKVQMSEVADEKAPDSMSAAEERQVKVKEGERILAQLNADAYVIALSLDGQAWSSEQLAGQLAELGTYGRSKVSFVIGGSLGLSDGVLQRSDMRLSFGRMTYPHQLMRLILVEQVYRAFKIMRGEPYHK